MQINITSAPYFEVGAQGPHCALSLILSSDHGLGELALDGSFDLFDMVDAEVEYRQTHGQFDSDRARLEFQQFVSYLLRAASYAMKRATGTTAQEGRLACADMRACTPADILALA